MASFFLHRDVALGVQGMSRAVRSPGVSSSAVLHGRLPANVPGSRGFPLGVCRTWNFWWAVAVADPSYFY